MATGGRGALSLLQNYGSESEGDSGYTSEDEKKRKTESSSPHERKKKKRRAEEDEEMAVDHPSSSSSSFSSSSSPSASSPRRPPPPSSSSALETMMMESHNISLSQNHHLSMDTTSHTPPATCTIPLPRELLQAGEEHIDDPLHHQGRIRSFAHERGNWASILYVPLHLGVFAASFASFIASLVAACQDHNLILTPSSDLHISLTRTLILRLHWIQPLTEDLRAKLSKFSRFSLWLHGLSVYVNEERTRTFLGIRVCHGRNELDDIVSDIDSCIAEYRLPQFYKDGSYHVSIAWCTGDVSESLRRLLPQLENICSQYFSVESEMRTFNVDSLLFRTGNRIHTINLKAGH
ncbi:U6 snRNA phosphodiesterase-like [Penaeus japonicus]|uniref:U6 snRNA phosphodiesterase-like n=1 Tax=Penaeus japonicus TaxID=27405 RepID=UPI001C715D9E|nr:U6 snRNA phosphodiesterase-like [Penaeus japonicus]